MNISIRLLALSLAVLTATSSFITFAEKSEEPLPFKKQNYTFKQEFTPEGLASYGCAIYSFADDKALTCRGDVMGTFEKDIQNMSFNPSGVNYILVSSDKKGRNKAAVFSPLKSEGPIYKFNTKKMGVPTASTYTPDARKVLLAADQRVYVMEPKKFMPVDTLLLPLSPTSMLMSGNGYYLVASDGESLCVYNFETKSPRQILRNLGNIADFKFNHDNSEFALLTGDGVLTIYDTRSFLPKRTIDDLDGGIAMDYNFDGKYIAVATSPSTIEIINLVDDKKRETVTVEEGGIADLMFVPDADGKTLMAYTATKAVRADRMNRLEPYYGKLIADEANEKLNEWLKVMPGETMDQYYDRVTDENRARQMRLFEGEVATKYADNLLSMSTITLGNYDRSNQVLALDFDNMPSIYLPVPEDDITAFNNADDLEFRNARYGVMGNDSFELIYAEVYNKPTGKTYVFDNVDRVPLNYMAGDDNVVSIEIIQQQKMEEIKLQEVKARVIEEAKKSNVISDHTNITVDSRVEPSYDADGNKILNYIVKYTYEVDPQFTTVEDFAPGKYRAEQSGAASSMLKIVKESLEGDLAQYVVDGKKLLVKISGTADATPILHTLAYDGAYGDFIDEPVYQDGQLGAITVTKKDGMKENEQLAFIRAEGVRDYLQKNVDALSKMNTDYQYHIAVSKEKGSEFRRITTEFTFVDAFEQ